MRDGGEARPPLAQCSEVRGARVDGGIAHEVREGAHGNGVEDVFAVRIEEDAARGGAHGGRANGIGTAQEAVAVVVVGEKIFPDNRRTAEFGADLVQLCGGDFLRDDFRAGSEDVDFGEQLTADRFEVAGVADAALSHSTAVGRGAEGKLDGGDLRAHPEEEVGGRGAVRGGDGAGVEAVGDIVEEQREMLDAHREELFETLAQETGAVGVAVAESEARGSARRQSGGRVRGRRARAIRGARFR